MSLTEASPYGEDAAQVEGTPTVERSALEVTPENDLSPTAAGPGPVLGFGEGLGAHRLDEGDRAWLHSLTAENISQIEAGRLRLVADRAASEGDRLVARRILGAYDERRRQDRADPPPGRDPAAASAALKAGATRRRVEQLVKGGMARSEAERVAREESGD